LVQQGLAAGYGDDGSAALVHGLEALGRAQALVQDLIRVIDLAATGAGEIAAEQRLEHEHQRVALVADQLLLGDVRADTNLLDDRYGHWFPPVVLVIAPRAF